METNKNELAIESENIDEPIEQNQDTTVQLKTIAVDQRIGQLLATGANTPDIVKNLQEEGYAETIEEALAFLHAVYASWRKIEDDSELELVDLKNWHLMIRHELLKSTIDNNPRAALAILESLAELQKINVSLDANIDKIPIQITLVPTPLPAKETPKESNNETK